MPHFEIICVLKSIKNEIHKCLFNNSVIVWNSYVALQPPSVDENK